MKKNITINLCGRLYQIDEDAYELLHQYTESLRNHFRRMEGGEEIADDIEARIAELLDELKEQGNEAITIDHIRDIISRLGQPEQMDDATDGEPQGETAGHRGAEYAQSVLQDVTHRKFFRNPNDKMVAGLMSGLASSFGIDPTILRVATVLLTLCYGTGLIAYIILALVIPEARTPEQFLQMQNKPVTPQNLADVVVEDKQPQSYSLLRRLLSFLLKLVMGLVIGILAICGIALAVSFLLVLVTLIIIFTVPTASNMSLPFDLGYLDLPEQFATHPWAVVLFFVGLLLTLFIPVYAIVHMLLSKSGKLQPMGIAQRIVWIVLWLASLCAFFPAMLYIQELQSHRYRAEYERTHTYQGVFMNDADKDFLRQGGWTLLKAENCDHYTWSGNYYTGDQDQRVLDSYNYNCSHVYQVERREKVEPGVYRLECFGRAEGLGSFVYAVGKEKLLAEIPPYGNEGGELFDSSTKALEEIDSLVAAGQEPRWKKERLEMIVAAHHGTGYGWSHIQIDDIIVTGDSIAYGLTSDVAFTGQPCRAKWFSACDFTLTRTGDLPKRKK